MRRSIAHSPAIDCQAMDASKPLRFIPSNPKKPRFNLCIVLAAVAVSLAVFFFLFAAAAAGGRDRSEKRGGFGIVIDGGSTGTRIHVFEFSAEGEIPVLEMVGSGKSVVMSMKVSPGLSDYAEDVDGAGRSIVELLEFGKGKVPKERWGETEVRLMATAGLRRLEVASQERVLESCRRVLRSSGFRFQDDWASVISGSDEGIYAWIAANYAMGSLGGDPQQTTGIIELGGASAQNAAYESLRKLLESGDLKLSAESVQAGISSLDPCTPSGYSHGVQSGMLPSGVLSLKSMSLSTLHARGNFSECRSAALMLLQKGKGECMYKHCRIGSTFIPHLQGKFLATENFFYTSKFFGLASTASLSDLILAGKQFCGEDWFRLKKKYHSLTQEDLLHYCFSSAYIVALLHDSLGFALDDKRIQFVNQVGGMPIDWALGAFILLKTDNPGGRRGLITNILGDDPSSLLSLFIVSTVLVFTVCSISKWRKPQLKTIYDLEKGRYIVTRVNR
ncbi:putative apyrase 6 [Cinnamomum micranthum f. kanehirae]|uniref:Putative apyrase 6 n=1 Tax=Cinnamomum micranthum f. kanehirae TaxID=337451 RepID=A0A3S3MR50_9MAGN|nr:putative apyrase 6 [Cinnamomum micranthum f. kanehirae]